MGDKNPLSPKELTQTYGDPGTEHYSGFFQEEPNAAWRDEARVDNVEEMRRTDGTVAAVLNALKAPILSSQFHVESTDESPLGIEILARCDDIAFNMIGRTFLEFLREALTFLDFGHSVFEIIWGIRDGKLTIVDLEPRIQHSIYSWQILDTEGKKVPGVTQLIRNDNVKNSTVQIPMEKLLVFTNSKEGDDITGQSVLRPAWKHFYAKDKLYRIGLIASERHGIGVPKITAPGNAGTDEKEAAVEIAQNYRANQKGYVYLPSKDWIFEIMSISGNSQSSIIEQQIEHHDSMILRSCLMGFIGLADGDGGSKALSEDQSSYSLKVVEDKCRYFCEQFARQVFHRFVFKAYPKQYEQLKKDGLIPYLRFNALGDIDFAELANVYKTLKDGDLINITPKMKQFVHNQFNLPEITDEELEEMNEEEEDKKNQPAPVIPPAVDPMNPEAPAEEDDMEPGEEMPPEEPAMQKKKLAEFKPWRELSFAEKRVKFSVMSNFLDEHQAKTTEIMDSFIKGQEKAFLDKVEKMITAKDIAGIAALTLTGLAKLKSQLKEAANNALEVGKSQAAGEMNVESPKSPSIQIQAINAQIDQMVEEYNQTVVNEVKTNAMNAVTKGIGAAAAIYSIKGLFDDTVAAEISAVTSSLTGTALNIGRSIVFDKNREDLYAVERSEILDDATCAICMSIDGQVVDKRNPFASLGQVHNNCRGLWVPILSDDSVLPEIGDIPKAIKNKFETVEGVPSINNFTQIKKPI